jgi:hypothetical protein
MHLRRFVLSAFATAIVLTMFGAFAVHTHDLDAFDDCCLCAAGSCPEPEAVTLALDQPLVAALHGGPAPPPPATPQLATSVTRRGPPSAAA